MKKRIGIICLLLLMAVGCGKEMKESTLEGTVDEISFQEVSENSNYVKIEMSDGKIMIAELYPDVAPLTVANFQKLVSEKFYDGLTFHRIVKNFMIQGGDPQGNGTGGSKETIKGEFASNGFTNTLSHERGVLSMARSRVKDSASSQFFICHQDVKSLDGEYATFGKLIAGYDTLDALANVEVNGETPVNKPVIKSIHFVKITE